MPNYKELFYKSQAQLADIAEELQGIMLKIQENMRIAEEEVISDEEDVGENNQK